MDTKRRKAEKKTTDASGRIYCKHGRRKDTCPICDPSNHLSLIVRASTTNGLGHNTIKTAMNHLGCTIDEYKKFITDQLKPGWTWKNFGTKWSIDHKIPLKYGKPSLAQIIQRLHYTNTQPMDALQNMTKSNRYKD